MNYVLCSNPRSGTTLLCDLLTRTGQAGCPDSYFQERFLDGWAEGWGLPTPVSADASEAARRYVAAARLAGQGGTPVFGLRLMAPDLDFACRWLDRLHPGLPSDRARLEAAFGPLRFIHLSRQDKLAEAVSYVRAEQTGLWHRNADGSDLERFDPAAPEGFDAEAIRARRDALIAEDARWQGWFRTEGIAPLRLTYEDLAANPAGTLARVLETLGLDPALASGMTPGLSPLADETTARWIAQFRSLSPDP